MYKVLIADDELLECKGLEWILYCSFKELLVLPYVQNGIELLKAVEEHHPDLLLLDINMPGLDGLEALEIIRMKEQKLRVILITAYNSFAYAQKAIHLGVSDYIVKPAQKECVCRIVEQQLKELKQEGEREQQLKEHMQIKERYEKLLSQQFITKMITGTQEKPEELGKELRQLGIRDGGSVCVLIEEKEKRIDGTVAEELEALLKKMCNVLIRIYKEDLYLMLFPDESVHQENYCAWLQAALGSYLKQRRNNRKFRAGVGSWKYDSSELRMPFQECRAALREGHWETEIFFFDQAVFLKEEEKYFRFCRRYLEFIRQGDYSGSRNALEDAKEVFVGQKELWKFRVYSLDLLFELWYEVQGISPVNDMVSWKKWKQLLQYEDRQVLWEALLHETEEIYFHPVQRRRYQKYVEESVRIMEQQYGEGLSMDSIAEMIGITPFYLSRLFKQELGMTFLEYLTDIRVIRAIELARENVYSVREISWRSGYPNSNYFYKIFKKTMGLTLGQLKNFANNKHLYSINQW